jgi:hypothetical protein
MLRDKTMQPLAARIEPPQQRKPTANSSSNAASQQR